MSRPFYLPVAIPGDPAPIILPLRDRVSVDLYLAMPAGHFLPVVDALRGRVVCVHKASDDPWQISPAHSIATLQDDSGDCWPTSLEEPLTASDVASLVAGGACPELVDGAPGDAHGDVGRIARLRSSRSS